MIFNLLEKDIVPDFLIRMGIRKLLEQRLTEENKGSKVADLRSGQGDGPPRDSRQAGQDRRLFCRPAQPLAAADQREYQRLDPRVSSQGAGFGADLPRLPQRNCPTIKQPPAQMPRL